MANESNCRRGQVVTRYLLVAPSRLLFLVTVSSLDNMGSVGMSHPSLCPFVEIAQLGKFCARIVQFLAIKSEFHIIFDLFDSSTTLEG